MSEIKDKATKLKEISKKYGYELKHTHALEIISQLDQNVNRHVALTNEKKSFPGFSFENAPYGIDTPFFQGYVIEIITSGDGDDWSNYFVTDRNYIDLEYLNDDINDIISMKFMTEAEVKSPDFSFRFSCAENPVPYKTLQEWIFKRAKESGDKTFLVVASDSDDYEKYGEVNDFEEDDETFTVSTPYLLEKHEEQEALNKKFRAKLSTKNKKKIK